MSVEVTRLEAARYEHDCDSCVYLGRHYEYDLYVCPKTSGSKVIGTLIARYGSDGPDYTSGWFGIRGLIEDPAPNSPYRRLHVALLRALEAGYESE